MVCPTGLLVLVLALGSMLHKSLLQDPDLAKIRVSADALLCARALLFVRGLVLQLVSKSTGASIIEPVHSRLSILACTPRMPLRYWEHYSPSTLWLRVALICNVTYCTR